MSQRKIKKDFDKEMMYSKIMPSITPPPLPPEPESAPRAGREDGEQPALMMHNFLEDIVRERVEKTIDMLHGCNCERCRLEVMALALNDLPAAYTVLEPDRERETLLGMRADHEVKVAAALIKAVQTVKTNPNH